MENYSWRQLHYPPVVQKTTNQIDHVPRMVKNGKLMPDLDPMPLPQRQSYPSCRPLKHYRKTGTSNSNETSSSYESPPNCDPCTNSIRVGKAFKMLGKKDDGELKNKACNGTPQTGTVPPSYGNVISFSGIANIRTGLLDKKDTLGNTLPGYYYNYAAYLKKRGNTYSAKSAIHPIPGVDYTKPPNNTPDDSSHYYENNIVEGPNGTSCNPESCGTTIYKPSNPTFATQGPVDSTAYIARQKYNTIVSNNASFIKPWGQRLSYTENPVFTLKNNFYNCKLIWNADIGKVIAD